MSLLVPRRITLPHPHSETAFLHTLRIRAEDHREPRTHMELTWSQLQKLADDFDLGRLVQMDRPLTTQCNTTDPFRTGQGTFLLRARHGEEYVERLEFLHATLDTLVKSGFPCPAVVRAKSGKSWTVWGDRLVEVHAYVAHDVGNHRDWNRMYAAAGALADLHAVFHKIKSAYIVPPEMRNDIPPKHCWMLLQEVTAAVELRAQSEEPAREALQICQRIGDMIAPLLRDYERTIGALPWMLVHGDYHFWNLLYRADQIAAVVDYDFMQERERLFDLAYAMQSVVAYLQVLDGRLAEQGHYDQLQWKAAKTWLDLYESSTHLPLVPKEREMIASEVMRIYLVSGLTLAVQGDPVECLLALREEIGLFQWLGQHPEVFI